MATASCQPPDRDIRVRWQDGALVIDFPWSLWRALGLQDRTWCIRGIELFDARQMRWTLVARDQSRSCLDLEMPVVIGEPRQGFVSTGEPELRAGVRYGVGIVGIGNGRVDFVLRSGDTRPLNIVDWQEHIRGPCGSFWGTAARECRPIIYQPVETPER